MVALDPKSTMHLLKQQPQQFVRPNRTAARFAPDDLQPRKIASPPSHTPDIDPPPTIASKAADAVEETAGIMDKLAQGGMFGLMLGIPVVGFAAKKMNLGGVTKAIDKVQAPIGESLGKTAVGKSFGSVMNKAAGGVANVAESFGFKKASHTIRNAPKTMAQGHTHNAIVDGLFIGAGALSLFGVARGATQHIDALRHMTADLTGRDYNSITTNEVLFGDVPPIVAKERTLITENTAFRFVGEGINMGVSIRSLMQGKLGMASMIVPMAFNMLGPLLIGESVMGVYKGLKDAHARGIDIPPDAVLEFIQLAQPELKKHKIQFSQALVEEYVAEKTSPDNILREANDGRMMVRLNAIVAKNTPAPQTISHVDRLNGKAAGAALPVVGAHTAKVAEAAMNPIQKELS